jgi:hypothetical protein
VPLVLAALAGVLAPLVGAFVGADVAAGVAVLLPPPQAARIAAAALPAMPPRNARRVRCLSDADILSHLLRDATTDEFVRPVLRNACAASVS